MKNRSFKIIMLFVCLSIGVKQIHSQDTIYANISVDSAYSLVNLNVGNPNFVILDVRTAGEYLPNHLANSINIDYYSGTFSSQLDALDKNKIYLLHCAGGSRSALAFVTMQNLHFREVYNMLGGINAWGNAGYPTTNVVSSNISLKGNSMSVNAFPNPSNGDFTLTFQYPNSTELTIEVMDMIGHIVLLQHIENVPDQPFRFQKGQLRPGNYLIRIRSEENYSITPISIVQ